jgi:uncharacterized membrane protein YedE/YeeE
MSQAAAVAVARPARGGRETGVLVFAVAATVAAGIPLLRTGSYALVGLLGVAFALGWVFLTAEFGYTAGFRRLVAARDGSSLAPGLLVAAVAALVIVPVAALVHGYSGYVAPIGLPLVGGAALFGLGMQLANGCASGTLYAAGGGSRRLWFTLPFFCLGGVLGSLILPAALRLPALPPVVLSQLFGPWTGLLVTLAMTGALTVVMLRHGQRPSAEKLRAAVLIGVLAAVAFLLSRQPWGVTMGLTVWGAKVVNALGFDLTHTQFWSGGAARQALEGSILRQDSSLMNIGMLLGAMAASAWQGGFRAKPWPPARGLVAAALGGLTMGIGARLAFGCNIGALVGGISSGSLHGFVWFAAALPGTWLGLKLRPVFGLSAN